MTGNNMKKERVSFMKYCFIVLVLLVINCHLLVAAQPLRILSVVPQLNGCDDITLGNMVVTISGGVAPYIYSACLSSNETGICDQTFSYPATRKSMFTLTNLPARVPDGSFGYFITVSDANGSSVTSPTGQFNGYFFPQTPTPVTFTTNTSNPLCSGDAGSIRINAQGGNQLYSYSLNDGPFSEPLASPIDIPAGAGTYTINLKDSSGCTQPPAQVVTLNSPAPVTFTTSFINPPCFGTKGSIIINAQGGSGFYTYKINGGSASRAAPSPIIIPSDAGTYTVALRDSNNCSGGPFQTVTLTSPTDIGFTIATKNGCNGLPTGSITVTGASGGTGPNYFASLNGGPFQKIPATFSDLAGSTTPYTLLVQDSKGCQSVQQLITIKESTPITALFAVKPATLNGGADGAISVTSVIGGVPPYTWNIGTGIEQPVTQPFIGLTANSYTATVTNSNGCISAFQQIEVVQPTSTEIVGVITTPAVALPTAASATAFAAAMSITDEISAEFADPIVAVTQANGSIRIIAESNTSLQYSINGINGPFQLSPLFTGLTAGTYLLAVIPLPPCTGAGAVGCAVVGVAPSAISGYISTKYCL